MASNVAVMWLFESSKKACMRGSSIGLIRRLICSTRFSMSSNKVTLWYCENSRAFDRPTYPAPTTVIFISIKITYQEKGNMVAFFCGKNSAA